MTKILVIDDDDLIRSMISNTLKKANYHVSEAVNGNDGLDKAKQENPDIIITDILMPDKEGIETIIELKSHNNAFKIIAMSSGGNIKNMAFLDIAKKAGAQHVMMKPFKSSDLLHALKKVSDEA